MKGLILAAGRGSRMGELTLNSPKCLMTLTGKTLLDYQLTALSNAGIEEIGLVCGYQKDKIENEKITTKFENSSWETTNMVRSLMQASPWLETDSCIISYSDIFYKSSIITELMKNTGDIVIAYDKNFISLWSARFESPLQDLETFRFDYKNNLIEIGNRTNSIHEIQGQYMGLLKFTPKGWDSIRRYINRLKKSEIDRLDITSLLKRLITYGLTIKVVAYADIWGEVDHITDLKLYESWDMQNLLNSDTPAQEGI